MCPVLKTTFCNAALSMVTAAVASKFIKGTTLYLLQLHCSYNGQNHQCCTTVFSVTNPINSVVKSFRILHYVYTVTTGSVGYKIRRRPRVYKRIKPHEFLYKIKLLKTLLCVRMYTIRGLTLFWLSFLYRCSLVFSMSDIRVSAF